MMRKKIVSLCMALALCLSLLPVTALAATVENITYLDENGTQQTAASATQVTNSDTQWTDGWYVAQRRHHHRPVRLRSAAMCI